MSHLLDTNGVSELVARQPDPHVTNRVQGLDPEGMFLSVVAIGELNRGIQKLPVSRRRSVLANWLTGDLLVRFGDRVLPLDVPVMMTWSALVARQEAAGQKIPAIDSLVAATAIQHGLALATSNVRGFQPIGVAIVNPWKPPA